MSIETKSNIDSQEQNVNKSKKTEQETQKAVDDVKQKHIKGKRST